jgi:CubicO group peptidase (beta-lactamase class C family)
VIAPGVHGAVAPGYERVAAALSIILAETPDRGAALAAVIDGRAVVDLWGGVADPTTGSSWAEDTIQLVFSGTKGLVATCMLVLLDRGALALASPVSSYWPEFGENGKDEITVGQAVSHMAAVPGLRCGFVAEDLLDPVRMADRVAAEAPFWAPGSQVAYHAFTYGWLCDALVRRIDGRSIGRFFADEIAGPLGLDLWIGLPEQLEPRAARLMPAGDYGITYLGDEPEYRLEAVYGTLSHGEFRWNEPAFHRAEIPGANAVGAARSVARLYACLARGGELDGVRLVSEDTVRLGRTELARGVCAITRRPYAFGVGFELQTELMTMGPAPEAFGHTGSGGSSHGVWPRERVGFSFAMNELRPELRDGRARRLLAALLESLVSLGG